MFLLFYDFIREFVKSWRTQRSLFERRTLCHAFLFSLNQYRAWPKWAREEDKSIKGVVVAGMEKVSATGTVEAVTMCHDRL